VNANEVWGVDISARLLCEARKKGIRTLRSTAEALPFKKDRFDLVVCMGVLPYYTDPRQILAQIARVTKPGGRILVTSTTGSWLIRSVRFIKNLTWKKSQLNRLYSPADIRMYLTEQGIQVADTCLGFNDQIFSGNDGSIPLRFQLLSRVAAAFGTLPEQ
jgi:2-polyprenyl-3-methyl-5-hydroxy-6-metoxy-1,4-benzoquinol methylase